MTNPTLKTDAYEYSMMSSLVESGLADKKATFELFARKLPAGRRFGVAAGLGRFLEQLQEWRLTDAEGEQLEQLHLLTPAGSTWLRGRQEANGGKLFSGTIKAYREGGLYSPYSPLVQVQGRLGEAILLETLLLSVLNHDSAVASAAARMTLMAQGRPIIEMGARRTDDAAALSAARAAYLAGFASTSDVAAALHYGIPTSGTAAHAYTLAHASELEAFKHQLKTWGQGTTLLVDTYDTPEGIRRAVEAASSFGYSGPGAIRIDSGDLAVETGAARELLDSLGATETRIVVSSDLDEYLMLELQASPIDGYGAGTRVVTGSGHPTAGMVYKLVEIEGRAVAKKSHDKTSVGGAKTPYLTATGEERYTVTGEVPADATPLYVTVVEEGRILPQPSLAETRSYCLQQLETLPQEAKRMDAGTPFRTAEPA